METASNYSQREMTFSDLALRFWRRRQVVYSVVAVVGILATVYCVVCTRRYEARCSIQVQSKKQDALALESVASASSDAAPDALAANIDIQTQANILQSDTLALKTIEDLQMERTEDFKSHRNPVGWVLGLLSPAGSMDPPQANLEDAPLRRGRALLVFSRHLKVTPIAGTRLIDITYSSPDARLAAAVVNKLAQMLIDYSIQERVDATSQTAGWLSSQLGDLRQQSEDSQRKVSELQSKSGVYNLGTVTPEGQSQTYSDVLAKLQQATTAVSQAEQNRILRGAILHAVQSGDAEMLSGLAGNSMNGASVNSALTVIQNLRGQEASEQAALRQAEAKYGPAHPKLGELRGNVTSLQRSIDQEIERLKERAKTDYDNAVETETESRSQYDQLKAQANILNNKAIDFTILQQEADESRNLYQELLKKYRAAGVLEGLKGSLITIVDPGRVPGKPAKPNIPLYMAVALAGGLFLGCCLALIVDVRDGKIKSIDEVERICGGSLIGITPAFSARLARLAPEGAPPLASLCDPASPFIEAARAIRAEIFQIGDQRPSKVILVTSSISGEGKTLLGVNLAVLLAQSNKKVLLVDADLRLGALHTTLNLDSRPGLSELLEGQIQRSEAVLVSTLPNLDTLQAGAVPVNPSELLGSSVLRHCLSEWRGRYDYIVLDSAPLLPVADSLALVPLSDITMLVARPGVTQASQLARSYQLLTRSGKQFVAVVVNGLQPDDGKYGTYFGYGKPNKTTTKDLGQGLLTRQET